MNIPSKIGQVAAVRALAAQRRADDLARGILVAAVCPGMMNTPTSALWWPVDDAPTPAQAAVPLLDLALDPVNPDHYGHLVRNGLILPWAPDQAGPDAPAISVTKPTTFLSSSAAMAATSALPNQPSTLEGRS